MRTVVKTYKFKLYKNKHLDDGINIAAAIWNYCSESCIKYIQKAKEIVLKCHIRLTDETWTTEQIVTQSLVEGMAKKAIK